MRLEIIDSSNFQRRSCNLKARNFSQYPNLLLCSAAMPANDTDCLIMHGQQIDGHGKKL